MFSIRASTRRQKRLPEPTTVTSDFEVDVRTNRVVVLSAIDNLGKGASSAVVQNLNVMFGLDETAGLRIPGMMP